MVAAGEVVAKDPDVQAYSVTPWQPAGTRRKNCQLVDQNLLVIALAASILLWL